MSISRDGPNLNRNCGVESMKHLIFLLLVSSALAQQSPSSQTNIDNIPGPTTTGNWNGVWNPLACAKTPAPNWCSGSDIGAWINAAISKGAARIFIPAGSYSQVTTIHLPRNVMLTGASAFETRITYKPSSGWAVIASDAYGPGIFAGRGGIEDLSFYGPAGLTNAFANQTGGIYFGGSDNVHGGSGSASASNCTVKGSGFDTSWPAWQPIILNGVTQLIASVSSRSSLSLVPTSSGGTCPSASSGTWYVTGSPSSSEDPSENFGSNYGLDRVRLWGFGVAAQWGRKAWLQQFHQAAIAMNGTGVYLPSSIGGTSGENISFSGGIIGNNGQGVVLNRARTPSDTDLHFFGVSFDYNIGWQIANGDSAATINFTSSHMEAPAQWIATYGHLYATDSMFTNGSKSNMLGYLIDNESPFSSISNTVLSNGGKGTTFNPSGQLIQLAGVLTTAALGLPTIGVAENRYANVLTQLQVIGQAKSGFPTQGAGISWNALGRIGEADFWNNHGGGSGGWQFFDCTGICNSVPTASFAISASGGAFPKALTVSTLPSASSVPGGIFYVTDSTAITSEGQTCAGGSNMKAMAFSTGSGWKCF